MMAVAAGRPTTRLRRLPSGTICPTRTTAYCSVAHDRNGGLADDLTGVALMGRSDGSRMAAAARFASSHGPGPRAACWWT